MDPHYVIPYTLVAAGAIFFAIAPFSRRYRQTSRWLRSLFFVFAAFALAWSSLGFFLLLHRHGQHSDLPWPRFWALHGFKSILAGLALGVLFALLTSPEFRQQRRKFHDSV